MRKTSQVSGFRAGLTVVAGLVALALSAPMAKAQDPIPPIPTVPRGGELKCANNLPAELIERAEATLVWTVTPLSGGPATTIGDTSILKCNTSTTPDPEESKTINQPTGANGWSLVITIYGYVLSNPVPPPETIQFKFSCDPDVGTFDAGGVPHIRLRCVNPNGGGAVTFALSRNPPA